jgi:nitronate monooxygenase
VATRPTTPWSGAVCSRMVMEYDDGVADMLLTVAGARAPATRGILLSDDVDPAPRTMTAPLLAELGLECPVLAAPMSGGPTTPDLVAAAAGIGSLGVLAGGYLTAAALAERIAAVDARTGTIGVNIFAPHPLPVDVADYRRYRDLLLAEADAYAVDLPVAPLEDDDHWRDKVDLLLERPPAFASFTFGLPEPSVLAALRRSGTLLAQTVTSPAEARRAAEAGFDALVVQSTDAGGHSGTLSPERPPERVALTDLLAQVTSAVDLPCLATGGIATREAATAAMAAGAEAVLVGTALLLAPESGTSATHRSALLEGDRETVVTRSFTGRPARGLRNRFIDTYDAQAPLGYPALHHLTIALRRAAAAAGDPEAVNLWAGTGYRSAEERPAAETLLALAAGL